MQNQQTSPYNLSWYQEGRLKCYQCKRSRQIQGQVLGLWKQYVSREITASPDWRHEHRPLMLIDLFNLIIYFFNKV
jgi:hypothetical protein